MMKQELHGFIEGMNYPDDLLNHSKEYFEQMTCGLPEKKEGDNNNSGWLEPQTELGQFVRAVALAVKTLQFEVPPPLSGSQLMPRLSTKALKCCLLLTWHVGQRPAFPFGRVVNTVLNQESQYRVWRDRMIFFIYLAFWQVVTTSHLKQVRPNIFDISRGTVLRMHTF